MKENILLEIRKLFNARLRKHTDQTGLSELDRNEIGMLYDQCVIDVLNGLSESITGYSCPNCGAICSEKTIVSKTKTIFNEIPDPHYSWDETHKCQKCETLYLLHNGT